MIKGKGVVACSGISIAKTFVYKKKILKSAEREFLGAEIENTELNKAIETAKAELSALYEKAVKNLGDESAFIFEVHKMLLEDEDFLDSIKANIDAGKNAIKAVELAGKEYSEMLSAMDDEYMKERAIDFKDISNRVRRILSGLGQESHEFSEPVIVIAEDLEPSETISFDKTMIKGFILEKGSTNSHTAILARLMNVPSLVNTQIDLDADIDGKIIILDASNETYTIDPTQKEIELAEKSIKRQEELIKELEIYRGKDTQISDGRKIHLYNNIGNVEDVKSVIEFDAEGIGLFRSEFLYLGRESFPTEDEQFSAYKEVASYMGNKKVIIRTLDIGADKKADYFDLEEEENPALGLRAIRICQNNPDMFRTQLRAILRASYYGNISIMFPMIISVKEVLFCKEQIKLAKEELKNKNIPYKDIELGIMIETPAAVMIADELAKEVDFFSVGTNDLTQYTLALDRQNLSLDKFYDSKHPAILKMLELTAKAAVNAGIWVGICGELASDMSITATLIKYGFTEFSVSPSLTLKMRKNILDIKYTK